MKTKLMLLLWVLFSASAHATEGGNTSGGGDLFGLNEYASAIQATEKAILESNEGIYSRSELKKLRDLFKLKILVGSSDANHFEKDHAVEVAGITQVGSAHSVFSWSKDEAHAEMVINQDAWVKASDRAAQMGLINHEFCVMKGIETTGDYSRTHKFLSYIRKLIERETKFRTMLFRFSLFTRVRNADGKEVLGEWLAEEEKSLLPTSVEGTRFSFHFSSRNLELVGCSNKTGALSFALGGSELKQTENELGAHCENFANVVSTGAGQEISYRVAYDPTARGGFEAKSYDLAKSNLVLVVQPVRYGSVFNYGKP